MGGGGGHAPHEVPDWRTFKAEGIPELDRLQKRLAARGLKDPWIRSEAWRYTPENGGNVHWSKVAFQRTFRGFGLAVAAMAVTIVFKKLTGLEGDHGHH